MLRGYSFVQYNGVTLEVVKLVSHKREAIFDEPKLNYLFTRHTLVVRATLAPSMSEHQLDSRYKPNTLQLEPTQYGGPSQMNPGDRNADVLNGNPITGLESDNAIRHALLAPRARLVYVVGPDYVIDAPHGDATCDVSFGPIPLFCHLERIAGMSTVSILYGIQVDLNQCPLFEGTSMASAVLSHEYSQQVEINEKFLTKRTTKGDIRIRADVVLAGGIKPDDFREYFAQACPAHYKRDSIRIVAHPDMTRLEYSLLDVEQERPLINYYKPWISYQLDNKERRLELDGPLSRVARLTVKHSVGGGRAFNSPAGMFGQLPPMQQPFDVKPPWWNDPNGFLAELAKIPATALAQYLDVFRRAGINQGNPLERTLSNMRFGTPSITEKLDIEITGNPLSTRYELELIGWYILMAGMPIAVPDAYGAFREQFFAGGSISFTCTHDVMANYVSMSYSYTRSAPQAFGIGAAIAQNDNRVRFGPMLSGEQSLVGREIIPGMTLHSYSENHYGNPIYDIAASKLDENKFNPWGRPGEYMHGTDPTPVVVDALHDQCEPPHAHTTHVEDRTENLDAVGDPLQRQPTLSTIPNLTPAP